MLHHKIQNNRLGSNLVLPEHFPTGLWLDFFYKSPKIIVITLLWAVRLFAYAKNSMLEDAASRGSFGHFETAPF